MKMNKMIVLVVLASMTNASIVQCMKKDVLLGNVFPNAQHMNQDVLVGKVFPKTFIAFSGWTGLSAAMFAGKKVYNNWASVYPENKDHYAKIARRFKITSRIAAIPLMSFGLSYVSMIVGDALFGKQHPESFSTVERALTVPGFAMTLAPAVLTTPDLFYED
jgi:hypothetical protein